MRALRLAYLAPLTPWPVLTWIQAQGTYSTGRHSAEALHAIGSLAMLITLVTAGIGLVALVCARPRTAMVGAWAVFALANHFALFTYVCDHAIVYV